VNGHRMGHHGVHEASVVGDEHQLLLQDLRKSSSQRMATMSR
jgi:hypothetical protein